MAKQPRKQVGALPWRRGLAGLEILLVTTRTTRRWVIPKGWPMKDLADCDAAAAEAFEEAGVRGLVDSAPFGSFNYGKVMDSGKVKPINVAVYALEVTKVLDDWPEGAERERQWCSPVRAVDLLGEIELLDIITRFSDDMASHGASRDGQLSLWQRISSWLAHR